MEPEGENIIKEYQNLLKIHSKKIHIRFCLIDASGEGNELSEWHG